MEEVKITCVKEFADVLIPVPIWNIYLKQYKPLPEKMIRVTELIGSPLRRRLLRENYENITRRLSTLHYQIMGTMIHNLFELKEFQEILEDMKVAYDLNDDEKLLELAKKLVTFKRKKTMTVEYNSWTILAEYDLYEDNIIYDFKVTSEFVVQNQRFDRYEKQLQIYRYLFEKKYNEKIKAIKNVFFLRDYSVTKSKYESPVIIAEYPIWEDKKVEEYLEERLALHEKGEICSEDDMMIRVFFWVGKRRFTDEAKAVKYSLQTGQSIREEIIPMGCLYFCEVADFCPQFQKLKKIFKSSNI